MTIDDTAPADLVASPDADVLDLDQAAPPGAVETASVAVDAPPAVVDTGAVPLLGDDGADPDDPTSELPAFATADLELPVPAADLVAPAADLVAPAADLVALGGASLAVEAPSTPPAPKIIRIGFDELPDVDGEALGLAQRSPALPPPSADDKAATPAGIIRIGDDDQTEAPSPDPRLRARRIGVRRAVGRKRLRTALAVGAGVVVVVGGFVVLRSPFLSVNDVELDGAAYVSRERVARLASDLDGTPLVSVDLDEVRDDLASDPWVKDVSVQRRWPDTVRIDLIERAPVATFRGADQGWRVLDSEGHVMALLEPGHKPADLLPITATEVAPDLAVGEVAPADLVDAASVVPRIPPELRTQVQQVAIADQGSLELALASGATVRLGSVDRLRDKFISTLVVLNRVDPATVKVLDVQVPDRPVLTPRSA